MSVETEAALKDWQNDERCVLDDLIRHFEDGFGRWDWCEIAEEARRVHNLMFHDDVEDESPTDCLWSAVAAQANHGAYAAVAAALGVDRGALERAVARWEENQDNPPAPVSPHIFMMMVGAEKRRLDELSSRSSARESAQQH